MVCNEKMAGIMFRAFLLTLITFFIAVPALAQEALPDYAIRNIRSRFTDDNRQTVVEFEVWNIGGAAAETATARLNVIANGMEIASDRIEPLEAQEIVTVSFTFPTVLFPAGSVESLRAAVGIGEVEAERSENIQNNFAQISITFPQAVPEATPEPLTEEGQAAPTGNPIQDLLAQFGLRLDLNDPVQAISLIGICGAAVVLTLLLLLILILLFQRQPDIGNWQPSYVNLLPLDPNSAAGRRQQWQTHAQNNTLPPFCSEGQYQVRKLANGIDGTHLNDWRVTAIRKSQFDMYGRVARSQTLAKKGVVRRLNGLLRRRKNLDMIQLNNRLRPVAKALVGQFRRRWNERNAMLPVALDIRLDGKHGEVRILFELFQCRGNTWGLVDAWEPEMAITGKTIQEVYSLSAYGQRPGETPRAFRARLQDDLAAALAAVIALPSPAEARPPTPTSPHLPTVGDGQPQV